MTRRTDGGPQPRASVRSLMVRHAPWWALMALGIASVGVGGWLLARPFRSLSILALLVALGLLLSGVAEVASAADASRPTLSRLVGLAWIVVGIIALAWPGITLFGLAVAVGTTLVVGGVAKVITAVAGRGDERVLLAVNGSTNVIIGALALSWPGATVLVLAVLFGFRTIVAGVGHIVAALRARRDPTHTGVGAHRWPRWVRLAGASVALVLALGGLAISVAIHRAGPDDPGPFYDQPSSLPDGPMGTIIRSEIVDGFHAGATTYRVLYTSTGYDGEPTAVSGLIVVPDGAAPADGRKVVAFTHGTIGVASNCAPSVNPAKSLPVYEGLDEFVAAGYVFAATDYQGLGSKGPHPYLVGASEAMNALDSVRAARNLTEANAGTEFAVWGHSQGGHASLFTGQYAATYSPELDLVGVAAGAPVPDLVELFKFNQDTTIGKVLISMALQSWSRVFQTSLDQIVTPAARLAVRRIAEGCLYNPAQIAASVPSALILGLTFLSAPPWDVEPWKSIVADNDPGATPTGVPMLITQGSADPIVDPDVTRAFVDQLCSNGETVDLLLLNGVQHVEAGHVAAPDVAEWIAARFAGQPPPTVCG